MNRQSTVIFDLCGTLYFSNTTYDFIKWYHRKHNRITYWLIKLLLSFPFKIVWFTCYKLNIKVPMRNWLIGTMKGADKAILEKEAIEFVEIFLTSRAHSQVMEAVKQALKNKNKVIIVSASIDVVVAAVARKLEICDYFSSTLMIGQEGKVEGKLSEDIQGKKLEKLTENNVDIRLNTTLYTDNFEDIPLINKLSKVFIISKKHNAQNWKSIMHDKANWEIIHV